MIEETVILAERVSNPRFDGGTVVPYHEKTLFVVRFSLFTHRRERREANSELRLLCGLLTSTASPASAATCFWARWSMLVCLRSCWRMRLGRWILGRGLRCRGWFAEGSRRRRSMCTATARKICRGRFFTRMVGTITPPTLTAVLMRNTLIRSTWSSAWGHPLH